jgi:hypothetical protein
MGNDSWRDERRELNRVGRWGIGWWIVIVVVGLLISGAVWGLTVALSGPRGQGDAIIEKNSAENWVAAQAGFERDYQEILTTDLKITNAYQAWQADTEDKTLQTNYEGLKSYCLSKVSSYNADARSFLSQDFRSADLPSEIPLTNSTTDCKE